VSRNLVFEIGVEEIPSGPLYAAISQLAEDAEGALDEARLGYGSISVFGSPRRLVLMIRDLVERQEDRQTRSRGPAIRAAFDENGDPTKAAEGFARGKGVAVDALERVEDESGAYVYAVVDEKGEDSMSVLPGVLTSLAEGVDWPKSMRWGDGEARFTRPVRWLLALFGGEVVPMEYAGLQADRVTWGHRFLAENPISVPVADEYALAMERGLVMYDQEQRATFLREGIENAAGTVDGTAVVPERVFAEVVNLVEYPTVAVGRFDEEFLEVPREVLETAMESHQRYFPVESSVGSLTSAFVVAHNGSPDRTDDIIAGHERVIRARLADASFFYQEDLKRSLESYVGDLDGIVFQERLGTLGTKAERIESLAERLAKLADTDPGVAAEAERAAHLCKADLVTHVVVEFPSLQGVMGYYYALASGEAEGVAGAIVEHYLPRHAGDALPASEAGAIVSVADKLDTMVGIFAIGMPPTGSADPYALRRGALGILGIIVEGLSITLDEAISAAIEGYRESLEFDADEVGRAVKEFFTGRLEGVLKERGHAYDTVAAVLAVADDDPADALARCDALTGFREREEAADLSVAFSRAKNLSDRSLGTDADVDLMGPEEAELADALSEAEQATSASLEVADYAAALGVLARLRAPIDGFFDGVLVMEEDTRLRENRLRLLNRFVAVFEQVADFDELTE
jgi:glycyl-tRNA synthetase beta chain